MGALSCHGGSVRAIQPLPADLPQGIGPALPRRARLARSARSHIGIDHCPKGGQQGLPRLGIEVSIYPHHPEGSGRHGQPTPVELLLTPSL